MELRADVRADEDLLLSRVRGCEEEAEASVKPEPSLQLYDPRNGDLSLTVEVLSGSDDLSKAQSTNYFTVYWMQEGEGTFCADLGHYPFVRNSVLFLAPYQSFRFVHRGQLRGLILKFHANFLCIETHHEEVGCNGVLFNDTFGVPCVQLDEVQARESAGLLEEMRRELRDCGLAHSEVLLSYLKIFLVRATRLKLQQQEMAPTREGRIPEVLTELKRLIEAHFRDHHAPADYARMLHMSPKALSRVVRLHLKKTLTELIRERIIRQAKWELLHTLKPVKQVAAELGFADTFYFSRLFKSAAGCSPTFFRDYETTIRGGSNLSIT